MAVKRQITCIECPKGCLITAAIESEQIISIRGNGCDKGKVYIRNEINNPLRIITSSVLAVGLQRKMIPVKIDKPVPKSAIFDIMNVIKEIKVKKPVKIGQIIAADILGLGVNVVATLSVPTL